MLAGPGLARPSRVPFGKSAPACRPSTEGSLPTTFVHVQGVVVALREGGLRDTASICDGFRRKPPCWPTASISRSKISRRRRPAWPSHRSNHDLDDSTVARCILQAAVASTTTGGFPGPATIARCLLATPAATAGAARHHEDVSRRYQEGQGDFSVGGSMIVRRSSVPSPRGSPCSTGRTPRRRPSRRNRHGVVDDRVARGEHVDRVPLVASEARASR